MRIYARQGMFRPSDELDFPNGGVAFVIGNVIEQSAATSNSNIIAFGEEGSLASPSSQGCSCDASGGASLITLLAWSWIARRRGRAEKTSRVS